MLLFLTITLFVGSSPWIIAHLSFSQTFFSVGVQVEILHITANRDMGGGAKFKGS
jgi:hypothetical protein